MRRGGRTTPGRRCPPPCPTCSTGTTGDGTFTDVTEAAGLATPGRGLSVIFDDLDGDGRIDIYVGNDGDPNFAWISQADGTFVDRAALMGLAVNGNGRAEAAMGIARGDVDGDGAEDLLITHLVQETNTLYRRLGSGQFFDETMGRGLAGPSLDRTGVGTAFFDLELDGDLDLFVVNGRMFRRPHPPRCEAQRSLESVRRAQSALRQPRRGAVRGGRGGLRPRVRRHRGEPRSRRRRPRS